MKIKAAWGGETPVVRVPDGRAWGWGEVKEKAAGVNPAAWWKEILGWISLWR